MKTPPKILFVAATGMLAGGGEISNFEIIMDAKKRGYKVHVVVPSNETFAQKLKANGIDYTFIQYSWWGPYSSVADNPYNMTAIARIYSIAKKFKADCIVTNSLNHGWGALAAAVADIPHIWVSREWAEYKFSYLDDYYDIVKSFSNYVLANSKTNAEYIKNKTGLKEVNHVYPYINTARIKLGPVINKPRLVNVGSIQPQKNQLELIKAAAILNKNGKLDTKVVLIGPRWDKQYWQKIQSAISSNNLQDNVEIHEFKENPYEIISPNDIFVQTSVYETFGRTTVEAMKLGLVMVAGDIPITREVIELCGGGQLYKSGSSKDLSIKLEDMLTNYAAYKGKTSATQKKAIKNLDQNSCHQPFFDTVDKAVGQPNPRRELRHLANQIEGLAQVGLIAEKQAVDYQKIIDGYKNDLDNILNSRSWKTMLKLRKLLGK